MRRTRLGAVLWILVFNLVAVCAQEAKGPRTEVIVDFDPRIEVLGILCRLAGATEFKETRGPNDDYGQKVDRWFKANADHQAVRLAGRFTGKYGIARDALFVFAAHLGPAPDFAERIAFDRKDGTFDKRLTVDDARRFRGEIADFAKVANLEGFLKEQRNAFDHFALRLTESLKQQAATAWVAAFFGEAGGRVVVAPSMLGQGPDRAIIVRGADGFVERWRVLSRWTADVQGTPTFDADLARLVLEDTARASVEPAVVKTFATFAKPAAAIFQKVEKRVKGRGIHDARDMIIDALGIAAVIRHETRVLENDDAQAAAGMASLAGLPFAAELAERLKVFADDRKKYPAVTEFMPEVAKFLEAYAQGDLSALDAARFGPVGAVLDDGMKPGAMTLVLSETNEAAADAPVSKLVERAKAWYEKKLKPKGVDLVSSDDLEDDQRKSRTLIAYGAARSNGILFEAIKKLAINLNRDFVDIGGKRFEGQRLVLVASVPSPFDRQRPMILMGGADEKDVIGLHDAEFGATDYVIFKCVGDGAFRVMKRGNLKYDAKGRLELVE